MKSPNLLNIRNLTLLTIAFISGILLSPKWTIALAAWVHYTVLLRFYRDNNWKGFLLSIPVLTLSSLIAQMDVIPMGFVIVIVMMFIGSIIGFLPFIIDKFAQNHLPDWALTFIFPAVFTSFAYLMDMGPQGTWGNTAYTQFGFLPLMQLASITGIYGINFLLLWFASFANYYYEKRTIQEAINPIHYLMPITLIAALYFGYIRLNTTSTNHGTAKMATITMENIDALKIMYEAEVGKTIELPPYISQNDPLLQELQKGMMAYMENPTDPRFEAVIPQLDNMLEKYTAATRNAATQGAKIITWSEAAIINIKSRELAYQQKMAALALELGIYLFFPTAVFHPEKVGKEAVFIENKVLTFSPKGKLVNTYFKNIPVMGVEPSFPGDGRIPVIETPYGNLSPIICYDADHPQLIKQVSDQATDLLVVPTGDWKAISPYHTYMAAVRCIENGVSMLKATSNGLSALVDDKGRILSSYDYFDDAEVKMIVQEMPIQSSATLYATVAAIFIQFLFGLSGLLIVMAITRFFLSRKKAQGSSVTHIVST